MFYLFALVCFQACQSDATEGIPGLTGTVTSLGEPVPNASVTLVNDVINHSTTTGADGKFSFTDIEKGEYILTVKAEDETSKFIQYQKNVSVLNEISQENIQLPEGVTLLEPSTVTDHSVELKWTKSEISNFLEYKLYRHSTSGLDETSGELIHVATNANDTVFTDLEIRDSETYFYRVFVRNTFGLYGGSNIIEVSTSVGNYVQNGDFEAGLEDWELYSPGPCAAIAEDITSPAGSKVLELNMDVPSEANVSSELLQYISQNKFIAGETYVMSFWAKADVPLNGQTWIMLRHSATWSAVGTPMSLTSSSNKEWTKYTIEFIAPAFASPALITLGADPYLPFTGTETYRVLFDGFDIHRK